LDVSEIVHTFAARKRFHHEQFKDYHHQESFKETGGAHPQNRRSEVFVD
jgi:hypothetical protein